MSISQTLSVRELAEELYLHTGASFVIVDAHNDGSNSRWSQAFPSFDEDQLHALGEPFVIRCRTAREAQDAFTAICRDLANEDSGMISGTVTYLGADWEQCAARDDVPSRTVSFDIGRDDDRPVFENGKLRMEMIAERL